MKKIPHLVVVGFGELVSAKYLPCIENAIKDLIIDGYSVIDLETKKDEIEKRICDINPKPESVFYLPDRADKKIWGCANDFVPVFERIKNEKGDIKVYIASELKAHEAYLLYCIENQIDSLVEKPIFAPMRSGHFSPSSMTTRMNSALRKAKKSSGNHSVMTLSRYHQIYTDRVVEVLKKKIKQFQTPITSLHFQHAGGIWNLHTEYETREDHPYKYGYGMIMHGAYHYVDLISQILELNRIIYPHEPLVLSLSSFAAYPQDQNDRISKKYSAQFDDNKPKWGDRHRRGLFGETDLTTTFKLENKKTRKTITIGTFAFEQTTPSLRSWKILPEENYGKGNKTKNGRLSNVNLEVQMSTLYSTHVNCFDHVNIEKSASGKTVIAKLSTRANAEMLPDEEPYSEECHEGIFHSDSNRSLMSAWLRGKEVRSTLQSHKFATQLIQALALSIKRPGRSVDFDIP